MVSIELDPIATAQMEYQIKWFGHLLVVDDVLPGTGINFDINTSA